MSMQGNAGASAAAEDIRARVLKRIEEGALTEEMKRELEQVIKWCDEIIAACYSGWY